MEVKQKIWSQFSGQEERGFLFSPLAQFGNSPQNFVTCYRIVLILPGWRNGRKPVSGVSPLVVSSFGVIGGDAPLLRFQNLQNSMNSRIYFGLIFPILRLDSRILNQNTERMKFGSTSKKHCHVRKILKIDLFNFNFCKPAVHQKAVL